MKTKIAIVCAFVALVGGYFYYANYVKNEATRNENSSNTITESAFAPQNQNNVKGSGTFANLLGLQKNLICDVSYTQTEMNTQVSGKVYTNGENMRANFTMQGDKGATETNMINNGKEIYLWGKSNGTDMAMKFAATPDMANTETKEQFDMNTDVDYSCENWNVDASFFVPPSDLTYMDMTSVLPIQSIPKEEQEYVKSLQCNACAQITDEKNKAECTAMFACQ